MAENLSAQRDRIQRQVEALERRLAVTQEELDLLSSETDGESDGENQVGQSPADLLAQREKIQTEIQNLEDMLGPMSGSGSDGSSSSDESELDLSPSVDSCLQLNLVYQQVVQETLAHLETLRTRNQKQQRELQAQISGPIKASSKEGPASSREGPASCHQHPSKMFLGSFLKPYFKDRLTGLGPPANPEAKLKALRMTGCLDDRKLRIRRWDSWQKTLLIHSVTRDHLRRVMQPKLSRLDFLCKKLSSAQEAERQQLMEQMDSLEKEIQLLRSKKEDELIGDRYEEHDWQKISNIDFEGTRDAEDIRLFWQNFLHPSINKSPWSNEEVEQLNEICRRHRERNWEKIAEELGTGRTAFMCLQMFQRFVSSSLKRGSWTPEEDAQLRELVQKMRIGNFIPYTQMSYFIEGRDPCQLLYRWTMVLDPRLKKGPWSKEEDQLLLQAVARYGEKCWWKVRLEVPGRSDGACRDRYLDCLKKSIKKGSFDKHEVELLKKLVEKHGVGRWAKIAAEIPHRLDAQCMREWRKLIRPPAQGRKQTQKTQKAKAGRGGWKTAAAIKKEENTDEEEQEDEDEVVRYMDSSEDSEEEQEQEEEYIIPPMEEWIPLKTKPSSSMLSFQAVELPPSSAAPDGTSVRSTVLERSGTSVIIGPPPRVLSREERHRSSAMQMVSQEGLRLHLSALKQKPRVRGGGQLQHELQAAVTPWIGNLLMAKTRRDTATDVLRERGERGGVSTSSMFLLLLQAMNVDTLGCREMIEQRRSQAELLAPPPAPRSQPNPWHVSELLKQQRSRGMQAPPPSQHLLPQTPPSGGPQVFPQSTFFAPASIYFAPAPPGPRLPTCLSSSAPPLGSSLTSFQAPPPSQTPAGRDEAACSSEGGAKLDMGGANIDVGGSKVDLCTVWPDAGGEKSDGRSNPGLVGGVEGGAFEEPHQQEEAPLDSKPVSMTTARSLETRPDVYAISSDHPYAAVSSSTSAPQSSCPPRVAQAPPTSTETTVHQSEGRKRRRGDLGGADLIQQGKRVRRPTPKIREFAEVKAKKEKKKRPASSAKQKKAGRSPAPPSAQAPGFHLLPCWPIWVMTPAGSMSLAQAPPPTKVPPLAQAPAPAQNPARAQTRPLAQAPAPAPAQTRPLAQIRAQAPPLALAPPLAQASGVHLLPSLPLWVMTPAASMSLVAALPPDPKVPPTLTAGSSKVVGLNSAATAGAPPPGNMKLLLPAVNQSPEKPVLPYSGVVQVDPLKPPPLRRVGVHFDPSLMFLETQEAVKDWLSGEGGVAIPGARSALPYLPPFISTLNTLSLLLESKKSLMTASLKLLDSVHTPVGSQTHPGSAPSVGPDSMSEQRVAPEQPGGAQRFVLSADRQQVKEVRQLVAQRFSSNPAYQLLKARFLSCFTVPALLATVEPLVNNSAASAADEEEEEEEKMKRIQERGRRRKAERSLLLSDESAASACDFSGIDIGSKPGSLPDLDN
ncbi:snRNA-activating protein complex subunit 4 [Cyprinodon tularosa]|uniref:snRNA-activating protein complex subunit 4 n=1 Tax=Cyprinodon tularosa TaxID=77115 RepID=UPI0018E27FA0|nr:snRNA-activating protein complex subunit 4 [Cyprinodon tularosa]